MNKLLVDNNIVNLINEAKDITRELKDGENLIINYFNENEESININIIQNNNSLFVINYSSFIHSNCNINYNIKVNGNNNKTLINTRLIAVNNCGNVNAKVTVKKDTINNEITENIKGINENGIIQVEPILEINNNEALANHYVTVGSLDPNQLFYLQTKGLSYKKSYDLLKQSFIYNVFNEEFISLLNNRKEKDE